MNGNSKQSMDYLKESLEKTDPELFTLIQKEKERQVCSLEMIASENFTSRAVQDCLGSCLTNKYSEGYIGNRYYGGNEYIDEIEKMCHDRALEAFKLDEDKWGLNCQCYSGSPANFAVYTALVGPHGRIMGLDLPDGGHLTHGFQTANKKISASSIFFESFPYKIDPTTEEIDYKQLRIDAKKFHPKIIIAGISCFPRNLDYKEFRSICDDCGALLMADMAHVSGLVSSALVPSPFDDCDIVTTTTHKTLRGARGGIIFFRKGLKGNDKEGKPVYYDFEAKINQAVFPGLQGGPHNNQIAGVATALKQAMTDEFVKYQQQVIANAKTLASELQILGEGRYRIVTNGTDNHIVWVDMRPAKLSGGKADRILELVCIACNKNTVPGDKSAFNPSGIRFGTPALTSRGFNEEDMKKVASFIHEAFIIALAAQKISGPKLVDFKKVLDSNPSFIEKVTELKGRVNEFAKKFTMPGRDEY